MVCAFFFFSSQTSSFHPMKNHPLCIYSAQHSNLYPIFPSSSFLLMFLSLLPSTISAVFISILLLFYQLLILSVFIQHSASFFLFFFFSGRNHSPIFILSSFVCEQRPQKVALGLVACRVFILIFLSLVFRSLTDFAGKFFRINGIGKNCFPRRKLDIICMLWCAQFCQI